MKTRSLALTLVLALGACGGSTGAVRRRSGDPAEVARALAASETPARTPKNATGRPFAYLASDTRDGGRVVAYDLARNETVWAQPAEVQSRIEAGRNVVVYTEKGGALVARDSGTGALVWRRPMDGGTSWVGHAVDGDDVYLVVKLSKATNRDRGGELIAIEGRRGTVRWRQSLPASVGAPAARGGVVAVPNQSQYVTLYEGASGHYLAEILAREETAAFVTALPEGFVFGSRSLFLASAETSFGAKSAPGHLDAKLPDFVRVVYHPDGYRPEQGNYSALDRNRLLWRMSADGPRARFENGQVVVHSFRYFFGMDPASGRLLWAQGLPRLEVIGSSHVGPSLLFATADGELGALDAKTGRRILLKKGVSPQAGEVFRGVTFDAEGYRVEGGAGAQPQAPVLHETLTAIVLDPDKRFSDVKVFALDELAGLKDKEVTGDLLKILERSDSPLLPQRATEALIARRDPRAAELYLDSVRTHGDYAEGTKPPRLDVLARALAGLGAKGAIPDLLEHLRLPDTDPAAVREVADAVIAADAKEAVEAFRDYLCAYRADPAYVNEPGPLIAATDVLLKLGGPSDRALLLFVAEEPKTISALRISLRRALMDTSGGPRVGPSAE